MGYGRQMVSGLLVVLLVVAGHGHAGARGAPINPRPDPIVSPDKRNCVENDWPFYYYRLPVIIQDITEVGSLQFVAFGYADGCKQSGKGELGGTFANIMELPGVWQPDVLTRMKRLELTPVRDVLPGLKYPGNNMLRWDLPDIRSQFQSLYNRELAASLCPTEPELVCPGIPPDFGKVLADVHYDSKKDAAGYTRWLIDSSHPDATAVWFPSALSTADGENFYFRHPGEDMKAKHSDGGLFRVVLHPVNLALDGVPETTPMSGSDTAIIPATIRNESSRARLATTIGWRLTEQTSAPWRSVNQWRAKGEQAWRLPQQQIPLAPSADTDLELQVTGVAAGQKLALMVNPDGAIPEIAGGAQADAMADNVAETTLAGGMIDLEVVSVDAPESVAFAPGTTYQVQWVIRNNSPQPVKAAGLLVTLRTREEERRLMSGGINLGPGESVIKEMSVVPRTCGEVSTVSVSVSPPAGVEEPNQANNSKGAATTVGPCSSAEGPGITGGENRVIIVPEDCIPNPDPTSRKPCTNYDLIIPD